jgi:hypothetical protein
MVRFLILVAVLALLCLPVFVAIWRSNQLFVLRVRGGRTTFERGRMPQSLFDELDSLLRPSAADGTLIALKEDGKVRLSANGRFDPGLVQQLRNVVGLYPLARIRAGGRPRSA